MQRPMFSVLMPTYNQAGYLPQAIESLLSQTFEDWEVVIVDDGSSDDTPDVLASYAAQDPRVRIFRKENGGTASALNAALEQARGDWICWLSSDDWFEPNKLEIHRAWIEQNPDAVFFHTEFSYFFEERNQLQPIGPRDQLPETARQTIALFEWNYVNGISICIAREVFNTIGNFDRRQICTQDFHFWLRCSMRYALVHIPERTVVTRFHPSQTGAQARSLPMLEEAIACVRMVNDHPFPALFHHLDLEQPAQFEVALNSMLRLIGSTGLPLHASGGINALIDRMREWLTVGVGRRHALLTQAFLGQFLEAPDLKPPVKQRLQRAIQPLSSYQPYDIYAVYTAQYHLAVQERNVESATALCSLLMSHNILDADAADIVNDMRKDAGLEPENFARFIRWSRQLA